MCHTITIQNHATYLVIWSTERAFEEYVPYTFQQMGKIRHEVKVTGRINGVLKLAGDLARLHANSQDVPHFPVSSGSFARYKINK